MEAIGRLKVDPLRFCRAERRLSQLRANQEEDEEGEEV